MNAKARRPAAVADSYVSTVRRKAPTRHKDVLPSSLETPTEPLYSPPPVLSEQQQALVDECASFLTEYKLNVLKAKLLGGIRDFDTFTDEEVRIVRERALKRGIDLY